MNLATGVDMVEIERVEDAIARYGDRFLNRIFTENELRVYGARIESLAARFAAKEAVAKALGQGIKGIGWCEIEVLGDENNAPRLKLYGAAEKKAQENGLVHWSISLSHTQNYAVAFVVGMGN
ncbi:MAG TPA: holo-ACP synthase [Anaerolineales bacterium]|nr:holo-ACP synthase [Anaerolineales bacterium]